MNRDRLNHLITVLKQIEAEDRPFDMWSWAHQEDEHPCGTAACALGWASLDPKFNAAGLELVAEFEDGRLVSFTSIGNDDDPDQVFPRFQGRNGFDAGALFFDISYEESTFLFDPSSYDTGEPTPADVISHIEVLLK